MLAKSAVSGTLLLIAGFFLFAACAAAPRTPEEEAKLKKMRCSVEIRVTNMACRDACPVKVRDAMFYVDGVNDVQVDYDAGVATVDAWGMGCKREGTREMIQTLTRTGYKAHLVGVDPYVLDPYSATP